MISADAADADREAAHELVARTRAEQDKPPTIEDPAVLANVIAVFQVMPPPDRAR